ncbi:ABC transporter permease [Youhaiella tibetensis]|uniref:ABC transporter permease n=1 Tax=Paradevosia tibetensis TaxID=1447062 RepID=A0A5B9DSZ1_9HYPH|nr:ABC transporter permease [Youhaiella tibetensis]AKR57637.1 ABC transporter permease [Devosia sp. H5989]QEE22561.1 ABC transporter permease [Youhaiella tibetensis]GGF41063.1 ABC transporter permease [Youhaiella tibetensis]
MNHGKNAIPVIIVLLALVVIWYAASLWLNTPWQYQVYANKGVTDWTAQQFVFDAWAQDRPVLPSPHQVAGEIWKTTAELAVTSKKSLFYHAWITLSATLAGFVLGTALGILLAVLIVHNGAMNRSLMPWVIASQTIPILALAPLFVVIGFNLFTAPPLGLPADTARFISKAIISAYLAFFPVTVGMVKGLRSPEFIQMDLMHTYNASAAQVFWKLRWPSALPYLFTSMKVGVAASLVGAIVGEMPTGAVAGLGARLLAGSYYGQTVQIWSALFAASALAAVLVIAVGVVEKLVNARMGARPA